MVADKKFAKSSEGGGGGGGGQFRRTRAFRRSEAEAVSFFQRNFAQSLGFPINIKNRALKGSVFYVLISNSFSSSCRASTIPV